MTANAIRDDCTFASAHLGQRLSLQQGRLRRQPQQRNAGSRCRTRLFPHHQHLAHPLLERLDPLAHRRRCDMQPLRCRVKAAELDHRGEGRELLTVYLHISNPNVNEESLAVLIRASSPTVEGMSSPLILGFIASFTLIAAIGAQNAFVLRQGIRREHVLPVVALCTVSDIVLISAGIAGVGALISAHPRRAEHRQVRRRAVPRRLRAARRAARLAAVVADPVGDGTRPTDRSAASPALR